MKYSLRPGLCRARPAGSVVAAAVLAACAGASPPDLNEPNEREGHIITHEDISKSKTKNGWEALRRGASHLNFQYTRQGNPVKVTHRGVDSFYINPEVLLVVDGTHLHSLSMLENILADNIDYIQILSARVGVVRYGTEAGNGVIVVKTGVPPPKG